MPGGASCRFVNLRTLRTMATAGGCATEMRLPRRAPRARGCPAPAPASAPARPAPHCGVGLSLGTCVVPTLGLVRPAGPWGRGTVKQTAPHGSPPHPASACPWPPGATDHVAARPSYRVPEMPQTRPSDLPGSSHPGPLGTPLPCVPHSRVCQVPQHWLTRRPADGRRPSPPDPPSQGLLGAFPPRGPFAPARLVTAGSPGANVHPHSLTLPT